MAFTEEQLNRLGSSYQLVEPQLDEVVATFYSKLFETAPQVRSMFPNDMSGQKNHLASAIKLVAQNIGKIENLADPLREMGARHVGYGTEEGHYPIVRDTLVDSLAHVAGGAWNEDLTADWNAALNVVAGYMIEGAQGVQKKAA